MKKSLQNKLKTYTALSTVAAFGASEANAQMISTTVNFTGGYESYDVDLDGDSSAEFTIVNESFDISSLNSAFTAAGGMALVGGNASFIGSSSGYYVDAFSPGSVIDKSNDFYSTYAGSLFQNSQGARMNFAINVNSSFWTAWGNILGNDVVVGARFDIDGGTHYGFVRLDVAESGEKYLVKDFGYEAQADIIAYADANYTSNYVALGLSDVDNQLNASDLKIRLTLDKTTTHYGDVDGFHVVLSKASNGDLSVQDIEDASGTWVDKFDFNPDGIFETRLESFDVDSDGDLFEQGVDYNVYVLTQDFAGRPMRLVSKSIALSNTLAIEDLTSNDVTIFTADGKLNIQLNSNISSANVIVNDILGKEIVNERIGSSTFIKEMNEANGVYMVTISTPTSKITKKVKL